MSPINNKFTITKNSIIKEYLFSHFTHIFVSFLLTFADSVSQYIKDCNKYSTIINITSVFIINLLFENNITDEIKFLILFEKL